MPVRGRGGWPAPATSYKDDSGGGPGGRPRIQEYRALKGMSRSDAALSLLRSVGNAVKPIMANHAWQLPLLVEVYPKQENLLGFNVNRGRKIALRLRHAHNVDEFIDEESITETMLHELAHNVRGPHDDEFFRILDGLTMEWYDLRFKERFGPAGGSNAGATEAFQSRGAKLGEGNVHPRDARARAADMAEKRWRLQQSGGLNQRQTLGGSSRAAGKSKAQLAAEAAERRTKIVKSCPSMSISLIEDADREQEAQEKLHGIEVITIEEDGDVDEGSSHRHSIHKRPSDSIDLDQIEGEEEGIQKTIKNAKPGKTEEDDDIVFVGTKKSKSRPTSVPFTRPVSTLSTSGALVGQTRAAAALRLNNLRQTSPNNGLDLDPASAATSADLGAQSSNWTCQTCTLVNEKFSLTCNVCDAIRPGLPCWTCLGCGHRMLGDDARFWCCIKCGTVKTSSGFGES